MANDHTQHAPRAAFIFSDKYKFNLRKHSALIQTLEGCCHTKVFTISQTYINENEKRNSHT